MEYNEQPKSSNTAAFVGHSVLQRTGSQHLLHMAIRPDQVLITCQPFLQTNSVELFPFFLREHLW